MSLVPQTRLPGLGQVRDNRRGFTLIELLVVVAIIALLISILVPSLGAAKNQAPKANCLANLRGLGQLAILYNNDYDGSFPVRKNTATAPNVYDAFEASRVLLRGDGRSLKFFNDPSDDFDGRLYPVGPAHRAALSSSDASAAAQTLGINTGFTNYAFSGPNERLRVSYGINTQLTLKRGGSGTTYQATDEFGTTVAYANDAASSNRLLDYQFPQATVLYADATWVNARGAGQNDTYTNAAKFNVRYRVALAGYPDRLAWNSSLSVPFGGSGTDPNTGRYYGTTASSLTTTVYPADISTQALADAAALQGKYQRHKTGNNIVFLDAHAETVPAADITNFTVGGGSASAKIIWSPDETAK